MRSEFQFIQHIKKQYSLGHIGDDCAVLPKDDKTDIVITTDLLVEDIDFRLEWTTPEFLGHKSLAVSLSDIAAMGAEPKWAMLSIGIPETIWETDFLDKFYEGWYKLARKFTVELVGGDISRTPEKVIVDSIVGGEVPKGKAILRSGAKPGDAICVTGSLGSAAGGLKLLESGVRFDTNLDNSQRNVLLRQLQPQPQLTASNILQSLQIPSAMVDVSDGFSSDLKHLCDESNVGAAIDAEKVPVDGALLSYLDSAQSFDLALNGGEDFELLFTAEPEKIREAEIDGITIIGEVTANIGVIELVRDGKTEILQPKGYRHF